MSADPRPAGDLIARADALRDSRQHRAAAEAYRAALDVDSSRADVWVQLGNMTKDDGDLPAAIEAYAEAVRREPRNADTFLQLGRALKLGGRRDEAFEAFAKALDIAPGSRDVIREVVDLGLGWRVERESGVGLTLALAVMTALDEIRSAIARIDRELPAITALTAVPLSHYDEYRRRYRVPPAASSDMSAQFGVVVLGSAPQPAVHKCLNAITSQRLAVTGLVMPALRHEPLAAVAGSLPDGLLRATQAGSPLDVLAAAITAMPDTEWLAIAREPVLLDPEATCWIMSEAHRTSAVAVFCDEDVAEHGVDERWHYRAPRLRGRADPELLLQGHDLGVLLAVRRDVAALLLPSLTQRMNDGAVWSALASAVSELGPVTHIPRVLVSRFKELADAHEQSPAASTRCSVLSAATAGFAIDVVIPTRNGRSQLEPCVAALQATAARTRQLRITIIDNGSDDSGTLSWLAAGRDEHRFSVLRADEPFNWSRLNNLAAAATSAPMILFLNDDVDLASPGWDDVLRELLSRNEVGAVGARLAYPDRTLQHAGMVLGVPGVSDHEGRGDPVDAPGPMNRWQTRRSVSAVTGAFLACRRDAFSQVGGFDADGLPIWFSDVDFCLKLSGAGLRVLYEPRILAVHHESKTILATHDASERKIEFERSATVMRRRWGTRVIEDPWYSPQYSRIAKPYQQLAAPRRP